MKKLFTLVVICMLIAAPVRAQSPAPQPVTISEATAIIIAQLTRIEAEQAALKAALKKHDEEPMWLTKVLTNPAFIAVIGGVLAGRFAVPK